MSRKQKTKAKAASKSTASKVIVVLASASQAADIEKASKQKRVKKTTVRRQKRTYANDVAGDDCYGEAPMGAFGCRGRRHPSDQFYLPSRIDELY